MNDGNNSNGNNSNVNGNGNSNYNNNPLTQMLNGNSDNPMMALLSSFLSGNNGGGNNMIEGLLSGLGGGTGNNILGNLLGNLNLGNSSSNYNVKSNSKTPVSDVKTNKTKSKLNDDTINSNIEGEDNSLGDIVSGMGNIDLSQISNMLAGIDLNNVNFSEMINSLTNSNSFVNNDSEIVDDYIENNDVEFKHTDPKKRTHNIVKNLEEEELGQLIYILAHLVDDRKLEMLNKIVGENSN